MFRFLKGDSEFFWSFSFLFIFQKPFVERVMDRVTLLVLSTERCLSPSKAVLLYKQLYVLKNFLEYSTVIANHIRVGYAEEFRWVKTVLKEELVVFKCIWLTTTLPTVRTRSKWWPKAFLVNYAVIGCYASSNIYFFRVFESSKGKLEGVGGGEWVDRETGAKGEAPRLVTLIQRSTPASKKECKRTRKTNACSAGYSWLGARTEHEIRFNNTSRGS